MKSRNKFRESILPVIALIFVSILANWLFYFQGGELITDINDSACWLRNIVDAKFIDSSGSLYLDNLDRSREYTAKIRLKTHMDICFIGLQLDGKPADFQMSSKDVHHKNGLNTHIYSILVKIGKSDAKEAVLAFNLSVPDGSPKIYIINNTKLVSAKLSSIDPKLEIRRFSFTSVLTLIVGLSVFLFLRHRVGKKIIAFLSGVSATLVCTFLINVNDFRYVYVLGTRRLWLFILFLTIFSCILACGYILFVSNKRKDGKIFNETNKKKAIEGEETKSSPFYRKWNQTDIYLLVSLGFLLMMISAYTFSNDFYIDDYLWLRNFSGGEILSTFAGPVDTTGCLPKYYRPLPLLFLQGQFKLFGNSYFFYYILRYLHLYLNCLLVFFIVKKITGNSFVSFCSGLWVAASMFSFSASAWLSSIFDVMMITFALLAVLILIGFKSGKDLIWVFVCLIAALMTKESSVMLPFVLIAAGLLFRWEFIKKTVGFYSAGLVVTAVYLFLRVRLWGGLGGMEDQYGFYSLSNLPGLFVRIVEICGLILVSPGTAFYPIENNGGWAVRIIFIALLLVLAAYSIISRRDFKLSANVKLIILGFVWIIFFSLPILFPFTLIRLGYILIPGAAFVVAGALGTISGNYRKKAIIILLLSCLAIVLSQQAVTHLRIGYEKYGKGAHFRDAKNKSLFKEWEKKLPEDAKAGWLEKISETK